MVITNAIFTSSFLLLLALIGGNRASPPPKCCPQHMRVQEEAGDRPLTCVNSTESRWQIWIESRDSFLNGECIDFNVTSEHQVFRYRFDDGGFVSKHPTDLSVFHKCCPLDHFYHGKHRKCVPKTGNYDGNYTREGQVVRIGLPHCPIIRDNFFEDFDAVLKWGAGRNAEDYCLDEEDGSGRFVGRLCQQDLKVCEEKRCLIKCCRDGKSLVNGAVCKDTFVHGLKVHNQEFSNYTEDLTEDEDYELIYRNGCWRYGLIKGNTVQYSITKQGAFRYFMNYSKSFVSSNYTQGGYCLEHLTKGNITDYLIFYCLDQPPLEDKFAYTLWSKMLSCVLLVAVIVIYIYLGQVRTIFGKILVNYCVVMTCLMGTLIITHLSREPVPLKCAILGYILIFLNIAAFAWVNIMSIDIWWSIGTPRRIDQRKKDMKRYLGYLLYGWGMPLCLTSLILLFDLKKMLPEAFQPYVGKFKCFMEDRAGNYARVVLLLIPQLILQVINTVLYIKTVIYCVRVKNDIRKRTDSTSGKFSAEKERLGLIVKLAIIMGLIWIFEVTTAFFSDMRKRGEFLKYLEIILDTISCLQGVFIFLIFICKKKTLTSLKKFGFRTRRVSSSTSVTQASHLSGPEVAYKRQNTMSSNESKI